jgi:hypothetical protein
MTELGGELQNARYGCPRQDVLEAGARGFLLKSDASRFLISAGGTLADHKPFFTVRCRRRCLRAFCSRNRARER